MVQVNQHLHHVFIRDTERRELWADIACLRVFPSEDNGFPGDECWLIIRKDPKSKEIKYQLSNAFIYFIIPLSSESKQQFTTYNFFLKPSLAAYRGIQSS